MMFRSATAITIGVVCLSTTGDVSAQEPIATADAPTFTKRVVTSELNFPWEVIWGPDDHLWVTERVGKRILRVNPDDGSQTVAVEFPDAYQAVLQDGVLGMALHPDLLRGTDHDFVYVGWNYDTDPGDGIDVRAKIQRYTYDPEQKTLGSPIDLISELPAHDDHLGGRLILGPDQKLYFSIGDQGGNWQRNRCNPILAQVPPSADEIARSDWTKYQGKILRLNLDGSIPDDNPTINGVPSHIYSYGHRNPQGLVFDADGQLFEAEHGPSTDDEINRIEAGKSYGWPEIAGYKDNQAYVYANWSESAPTSCEDLPNVRQPPDSVPSQQETAWQHPDFRPPLVTFFSVSNYYDFGANGAATVAASGLDIYSKSSGVPGWSDSLLLASLTRGGVYRVALNATHDQIIGTPTLIFKSTNRYRDIAIRPDGKAFYLVTDNVGPTRDDNGVSTRELANPGSILEFAYGS